MENGKWKMRSLLEKRNPQICRQRLVLAQRIAYHQAFQCMRVVIRIAYKKLACEFLQSFLPVLEPICPRSIELCVAAVTRFRGIAGYCVRQVRRQAHVLRQLPSHTRPHAISAIDASRLFVG